MALSFFVLGLIFLFYLLDKVCDEYFIGSLDHIAKKFRMPPEAAAPTLMAIGSSSPELFVSLLALARPGNHEVIGMGTIVGSAIFNILFVVGVSAIVAIKTHLVPNAILRDLGYYLFTVLLLFLVFLDGKIVLWEAGMLVFFYCVYVALVVFWKKFFPQTPFEFLTHVEGDLVFSWRRMGGWLHQNFQKNIFDRNLFTHAVQKLERFSSFIFSKIFPSGKHFFLVFLLSLFFIILFSWGIVECAIQIAHILKIPEVIIGLTVLAIGSSLPDFLSSFIVAKEGRGSMAIANPIGSDSFDILFGLGFPWLLFLLFQKDFISIEKEGLFSSLFILLGSVFLLFIFFVLGKWKVGKVFGWSLTFLYLLYLSWTIFKIFFPFLNFGI